MLPEFIFSKKRVDEISISLLIGDLNPLMKCLNVIVRT